MSTLTRDMISVGLVLGVTSASLATVPMTPPLLLRYQSTAHMHARAITGVSNPGGGATVAWPNWNPQKEVLGTTHYTGWSALTSAGTPWNAHSEAEANLVVSSVDYGTQRAEVDVSTNATINLDEITFSSSILPNLPSFVPGSPPAGVDVDSLKLAGATVLTRARLDVKTGNGFEQDDAVSLTFKPIADGDVSDWTMTIYQWVDSGSGYEWLPNQIDTFSKSDGLASKAIGLQAGHIYMVEFEHLPEPSALMLLGIGACGLIMHRRRRTA